MAKTEDALKILDQMVAKDVQLRQLIAEETINAQVAQMTYYPAQKETHTNPKRQRGPR